MEQKPGQAFGLYLDNKSIIQEGGIPVKYVSVELTGKKLSILLCDTAAAGPGEVYMTVLPKAARGSAFMFPEQTARFLAAKLKERHLKRYPVCIMLDSEQIVSATFAHYPAPADKMRKIAELYSESSLPSASNCYVAYSVCEHVHTDGQNRSMLYAAPAEHVKSFYRALKRAGVNVYAIEASNAAFSRLVLEQPETQAGAQSADIYIDFGESSSLVAVRKEEQIVFLQSFTSIYQDIIDTYTEISDATAEEVATFIGKTGLNDEAEIYRLYPELLRRMNILIDVTLDEIFRTLRIAFSGERLDAGRLFISGDFTHMPGFVDRVIQNSSGFVPDGEIRVSRLSRLSGAEKPKKEYTENLLYPYHKKLKRTATTALVACILVLLTVTIFPIQFVYYNMQQDDYASLEAELKGSKYTEIRNLLAEKKTLENLKAQLKTAFSNIPTDNPSKAGEILDILHGKFKSYAKTAYVRFDNRYGTLEIDFTTESLDKYLALKTSLEKTGLFTTAIPFSCSFDGETGSCTAHISIAVSDFTVFEPDA